MEIDVAKLSLFTCLPAFHSQRGKSRLMKSPYSIYDSTYKRLAARGGAVVEALRYKPKGRGIDS
jgi:hypothetical protein